MNRTTLWILLVLAMVTAGIGPVAATSADIESGPAAVGVQGTCSFPMTATDATETEVTVNGEPQRVVALGASTAQIMWELGAQEKVVGMPVNPTTAYLNGSQSRTGIYQADQFTVATEQVVGLEPDIVLAPNIIPNETVEQLRGAGLTVYKFDFASSLGDVYDEINRTGQLIGTCEQANETVTNTTSQVNTIRSAVEGEDRQRVLYGADLSAGYVAGNGTFIHQVVETAGGDNIAANAGIQGYQQISPETVAQRDPEWIIVSNASTIPEGEPWASTTAVQEDQVIEVNSNLISQPAPRVVTPMVAIARQLHPQAMEGTNLTTNATTERPVAADGGQTTSAGTESGTPITGTAVATDGGTAAEASGGMTDDGAGAEGETTGTGDEGGTETTSGNGAGFGAAVAALALLAAALFARRRE